MRTVLNQKPSCLNVRWLGFFYWREGKMKTTLIAFITVLLFSTTGVYAELYDRGNGLIYDDVLNVTWLQDANYAPMAT